MKKLLSFLVVVLLPFVAPAQNHTTVSLLSVAAIGTGTNSLGVFGVTNISVLVTNAGLVHSTNLVYTNLAGTFVRSPGAAGGTNNITTAKLFNNASLWMDRDGRFPVMSAPFSADVVANNTNYVVSPLTLFIRLANPLGSNGAVGINLCPLWDGVTPPANTSDDISIRIPYTIGAVVTLATNLPIWRWPGAKAFTVRNITNQTALGGEIGILSNSWVTDISAVGFIP